MAKEILILNLNLIAIANLRDFENRAAEIFVQSETISNRQWETEEIRVWILKSKREGESIRRVLKSKSGGVYL